MTNKNEMLGSEKEPEITPEVKKQEGTKFEDLTEEQKERYEFYMETHPEPPVVEQKTEAGERILELEALLGKCETEHPIAEIYLIATYEEAKNSPLRKALKAEIPAILAMLRAFKDSDFSAEKRTELWDRYQYLNNAVGTVNGDTVDHDRHY